MRDEGFFCSSIYGLLTRQPIVQVEARWTGDRGEVQNHLFQMSPANARELALNLLQTAEAADMDAIVVKFLNEKLHQPMETAAAILNDFRKLRDELEQGK